MSNKYGLSLGIFGGHTLDDTVMFTKKAEELGMEACWIFEDYFYGGAFTTATACALNTEKINIAIGVINPFTRHPALTAMEAASLDSLAKGRFILGMGGSNKGWIQMKMGIPFEKPITAASEAVAIIKELIAEGHCQYDGDVFKTGDIELEFPRYRKDMPIFMGVKGPKALEKAGEIADGVVMSSCTSIPYIKYAKEYIAKGCLKAGKNPDDFKIAAYFPTAVSEDPEEAKALVRPYLAKFIGIHGFHPIMFEAGLTEAEIQPFIDARNAGNPSSVIPLVTDKMIDTLAVAGTPEYVKAKLEAINDVGVCMPIAFELPGQTPQQLLESLEKYVL